MAERGTILGGNPIEIDILRAGEHTVVICNLPYVIAKECLYKLLSPCGAIKDIVKIPARPTGIVVWINNHWKFFLNLLQNIYNILIYIYIIYETQSTKDRVRIYSSNHFLSFLFLLLLFFFTLVCKNRVLYVRLMECICEIAQIYIYFYSSLLYI